MDIPQYNEDVGVFVNQLRAWLAKSQKNIADSLGLAHSTISRYESGKSMPELGYITFLAKLAGEKENNHEGVTQSLLFEINKIIPNKYEQRTFKNWQNVCTFANVYLQGRRGKDQDWASKNSGRLPSPTYQELIGVEKQVNNLLDLLRTPDSPWIIAVEGLGGLGKTSLVHKVATEMINRVMFDEIGWVSAKHTFLDIRGAIEPVTEPALDVVGVFNHLATQLMGEMVQRTISQQDLFASLKKQLKQSRHCIIIDNLETLADLQGLIPRLREFTNPTKFLLTSRKNLYHETIYHYTLAPLSKADTLTLIRHEAQLRNLAHVSEAKSEKLETVFKVVGGNPLAIRLVVGQIHICGLDAILEMLTKAEGKSAAALYTFIYRQAWDMLDEGVRQVLLSMVLMSEHGGSLQDLTFLTELTQSDVIDALSHLVNLNLVNNVGGFEKPYYTIHQLTRTFLQKQVAKW